jgi:hypothetical protein
MGMAKMSRHCKRMDATRGKVTAETSRLVSTDTSQEQSSARSLMPLYPPIASGGSVADQRAKEDDGGLGRKYAGDKLRQVARGWEWPKCPNTASGLT